MRHRLLALLLFLGLPLIAVGVATPANAQTPLTVEVTSATLVARGAALDLDVTVTCEEGTTAYLSASVSQRSGNAIAQGYGYTPVTCTGEPQTVTVSELAQAGGAPFRRGVAAVTAELAVCDQFGCQSVSATQTIEIAR